MKQKTLTISIDKEITEQFLVENCLNLASSGYDNSLTFAFYALANSWHIDKLIYYRDLINGNKTIR